MSALLGLLPFVFGAVAIVVYARAKRPIARSLGLYASRWSPLEVAIGLAVTFVAIGLDHGRRAVRAGTPSPLPAETVVGR